MEKIILAGALLMATFSSAQMINENLKMNQIQVIGSHNSYKKPIAPKVYDYLLKNDTDHSLHKIQYGHIPIIQQLDMGLRNIEIDVYADTKGGRYAHPAMLNIIKPDAPYDPEGKMLKPGFKMIHILDVDFQSWYYTLADCLKDLKNWSDEHPDHTPIFITLEPKEGDSNMFGTVPEKFTPAVFDLLDKEILKNLTRKKIIAPDDLRGKYKTLNDAAIHQNWPKLKEARGKFMFILDKDGATRENYTVNHPSLKGRLIFTNSAVGTPESAAMIMNDPANPEIIKLVKQGYIIRTRADADTEEARKNDYSRFESAKKSGAQIITTDYYEPSKLFPSEYKIRFDDGGFERINPAFNKN